MSLAIESPCLEDLCIDLGTSEKVLNQLRDGLQDWLKLQPHLPQDVPKEVLEYFILNTKMSMELAKQKLDMFYTIRKLLPELYAHRDPRDTNLIRLHTMMQIAHLPKLTPDNYRVCILRPFVKNYNNFDVLDSVKYSLMAQEILMTESRSVGIVYLVDHSMLTLGLLAKYTPTAIRKSEVALTEAYAQRIKGIHFVNAAPLTDRLIVVLKKILKPKLAKRIHVHVGNNFESLHQHLPKSILPKEYGGDEQSTAQLAELWRQRVDDKREWFLEQEKIVVDEKLRPSPAIDSHELFGFSGCFRQLDVD